MKDVRVRMVGVLFLAGLLVWEAAFYVWPWGTVLWLLVIVVFVMAERRAYRRRQARARRAAVQIGRRLHTRGRTLD